LRPNLDGKEGVDGSSPSEGFAKAPEIGAFSFRSTWETETETEFVDVVAHRGNETIYAEVKGRTDSRPGAGLDTLYGQLLRRMPAEEIGDPNTRFAVVIPTGAEAAALRVPRRVRDVLRIDVYAVSDDGQVERLAD
jgi:hypothetical protein